MGMGSSSDAFGASHIQMLLFQIGRFTEWLIGKAFYFNYIIVFICTYINNFVFQECRKIVIAI